MMPWSREQIDLGQRFSTVDSSTIYEVVAITDKPTVVLRPVYKGAGVVGGMSDLHFVIDSDSFSRFKKVKLEGPHE